MAAQETKLRLLYIWQILSEETDEDHILSAASLIDLLSRRHDVTADRIRDILSDFRFSQEEKKETSSIHNLLKSWKEKRRND